MDGGIYSMGIKREIGKGNQILLQSLACCMFCPPGILLIGLDERMDRNREIVTVQPGSLCHGVTYQMHFSPNIFP